MVLLSLSPSHVRVAILRWLIKKGREDALLFLIEQMTVGKLSTIYYVFVRGKILHD